MSGLCGSVRSCVLLCICCFARSLVRSFLKFNCFCQCRFVSKEELTGTRDTHVVLGGGWVRVGEWGVEQGGREVYPAVH